MKNSLASDEVQLPKMMQQRDQHKCHQNVLENLNFCLVNQMQLPHYTCHPKPSQEKHLHNPKSHVNPLVFQPSMAIVQKNSQIGDVHGRADGTNDVGDGDWEGYFDEDERIGC